MKSVIIHGEATQELDNAIKYYEKQKIGLGIDLLSEIEQALEKQPAPLQPWLFVSFVPLWFTLARRLPCLPWENPLSVSSVSPWFTS